MSHLINQRSCSIKQLHLFAEACKKAKLVKIIRQMNNSIEIIVRHKDLMYYLIVPHLFIFQEITICNKGTKIVSSLNRKHIPLLVYLPVQHMKVRSLLKEIF